MLKRRWYSGLWRMMSPSYYLTKPDRLAFIFIFYVLTFFICTSILVWDRKTVILNKEIDNENVPTRFGTKAGEEMVDHDDIDHLVRERRNKVKDAMIHAWSAYEKYAWGYDELRPQSQEGENSFGGLGATIIDSLDTLYIMGLHKQFQRAKDWVASNLDFNKDYDASVFETTIRILGGLLSAYDLTKEKMFLNKARDLANRLLPAWNTQTGIPYTSINLAHGTARNPAWNGGSSVLADLGSEQLEFIALSQRTGNPVYMEKVENVINVLRKNFPSDGLLGIYISPVTGKQTNSKVTFGGMGDSFYEYLLKVWIQGNKTQAVEHYRSMWDQSMKGLMTLIKKSTPSTFTYIAERSAGSTLTDKMEELACFAPGMLALGSEEGTPAKKSTYLNLAKELTRTCYQFYQLTPTKLAGENYYFSQGKDMNVDTASNILRPETVESLMYLWRKTGDNVYRDWGWNIFQAFEANCRTKYGYVGLQNVNTGAKDNKMQSFFLAETLKYLYLLFSPSSVIPLDQWVFNTEAHPLRIISRAEGSISSKETVDNKGGELNSPEIQNRKFGWTRHEKQ